MGLFATACVFEPPSSTLIGPAKDAGEVTPDPDATVDDAAGTRDASPRDAETNDIAVEPDAGEVGGPVADPGPDQTGIPWDTFRVDGSGSLSPSGDPLTYHWHIASAPSGFVGGFAPFPGVAVADAAQSAFYADRAGRYLLVLEVSDGRATSTATATIEVSSFQAVPAPGGGALTEVVALAPAGERLFLGVKMHGGEVFDLRTRTSSAIPCLTDDKINDIAIAPGGAAYYAFDDASALIATDGLGCTTVTVPAGPTKIKDIEMLPNGDFYLATDRNVFGRIGGTFEEYEIEQIGGTGKYSSVAVVGRTLWLGSDQAGNLDGAVFAPIPPDQEAPILSFFPGDDKIEAIAAGAKNPDATWMAAGVGIVHIPDTATPTISEVFTAAMIPSPLSANMVAVATDPDSGDVYFANPQGIARYKRDVRTLVAIPKGTSNLPAGDLRAIAFDRDRRALFVGSQSGAFLVRP